MYCRFFGHLFLCTQNKTPSKWSETTRASLGILRLYNKTFFYWLYWRREKKNTFSQFSFYRSLASFTKALFGQGFPLLYSVYRYKKDDSMRGRQGMLGNGMYKQEMTWQEGTACVIRWPHWPTRVFPLTLSDLHHQPWRNGAVSELLVGRFKKKYTKNKKNCGGWGRRYTLIWGIFRNEHCFSRFSDFQGKRTTLHQGLAKLDSLGSVNRPI